MNDGLYLLVSGRWDNVVSIVDPERARDPATYGTPAAILSRPRVTPDIPSPSGGFEPASGQPVSMALSPDGRTAFIIDHSGTASEAVARRIRHGHPGAVTVLDLEKALDPANDGTLGAVVAVIPTGASGPVAGVITPDGRHMAVTSAEAPGLEDGGRQVLMFDLAARRFVGHIDLAVDPPDAVPCPHNGPHPGFGSFPCSNGIAASPLHGGLLVTGNGGTNDISVLRLDPTSANGFGTEIARVPVEAGPFGVAVSPDGRIAAVANRENPQTGVEGNTVSLVDLDRVVAGDAGPEVARIRVGTDHPDQPTRPFAVAFTPDGSRLLASCFRSDTLSLIDVSRARSGQAAETARLHLAIPDGRPAQPRGIAITPDGTCAAVIGGPKGEPRSSVVWLIDLATFTVSGLVTEVGNESYLLAFFTRPAR